MPENQTKYQKKKKNYKDFFQKYPHDNRVVYWDFYDPPLKQMSINSDNI